MIVTTEITIEPIRYGLVSQKPSLFCYNPSMEKSLVVILGPTSSGKTSLAISLCKKYNGEIISADSRQIYKYMDIGTGKVPVGKDVSIDKMPGTWKVDGVYTHGYDWTVPGANFTVVEYARKAKEEIESCWRRGKIPFLVGGTGFYIDVVLGKVKTAGVAPDLKLRGELEKLSCENLFEKLKILDPIKSQTIDNKNKVRLIRSLEIATKIGFPNTTAILRSEYSRGNGNSTDNNIKEGFSYDNSLVIGLKASNELLYNKVDAWAEAITRSGSLEKEVRALLGRGYRESPQMKGLIYDTMVKYIDGETPYESMLERIKFDLHGYIRRQLTWFKRDQNINWFDISSSELDNEASKLIGEFLGHIG